VKTRRDWLASAAAITGYALLPMPLSATPAHMQRAMHQAFGDSPIATGRVALTLPALAENGNSVRLSVAVDSPMTDEDHVEFIALFAEANPLPDIARFELGPLSGRAEIETRIRLSAEQSVVAVAGMNDGSLWSGSATIVVTIAACLEGLI